MQPIKQLVLRDVGVISQVPMNWVTLMSSVCSQSIECRNFGTIEFIHTKKRASDLGEQLAYDSRCRLWRASVALAIKDMKATRRSLDLIDWEPAREFKSFYDGMDCHLPSGLAMTKYSKLPQFKGKS